MTTKRTTILLDADLLDRLDRAVRVRGTTKTAVIAAAVETWLETNGPSEALPFVGYGRSGHGRLSIDGRSIVRREQSRGR